MMSYNIELSPIESSAFKYLYHNFGDSNSSIVQRLSFKNFRILFAGKQTAVYVYVNSKPPVAVVYFPPPMKPYLLVVIVPAFQLVVRSQKFE